MANDPTALPINIDDAQFDQLLGALSNKAGGIHWEQVLPVFLSALLAFLVGIGLETVKTTREKRKVYREKLERQRLQVEAVTVGIAYNVEVTIHAVFQGILPHCEQSHAAYEALKNAVAGGPNKVSEFFLSLGNYPAVIMTYPPLHLEEFDFLEKLPFLIELDAELVKNAAWMKNYARLLNTAFENRNTVIAESERLRANAGGALNVYQVDQVLQSLSSIADSECVHAHELIEQLTRTAERLEKVSRDHLGGGKCIVFPPAREEAVRRLKVIRDTAIARMPVA